MKRITRKQLRGKALDPLCKKANTTTNEYRLDDRRVFCCGIWEAMKNEPTVMCRACKAFIQNEEPPKGGMSMGAFDGFFDYGYEDEVVGRCSGCSDCRTVYATGAWQFKGCYHEPYHGKWVVEIENCPKEE